MKKFESWSLANVGEKIPRHVSTQQILSLLDEILTAAATPLFMHTTLARRILLQVVLQYSSDNRRKISTLDKSQLNASLFKAGLTGDFSLVMRCKLDRSLLFSMICRTYRYLEECTSIDIKLATIDKGRQRLLKRRRNLSQILGTPEHLLSPLSAWVKSYIDLYSKFYAMVVSKYYALAHYKTKNAAHFSKLYVERGELYNNLLLAVMRAINRCDQEKGTLTSHVENWFQSAINHPEHSHQYNESYTIPPAIRREFDKRGIKLTNFANPIPQEDIAEIHQEIQFEQRFLKEIDTNFFSGLRHIKQSNVAYLALGLPIVLTAVEKTKLQLTRVKR